MTGLGRIGGGHQRHLRLRDAVGRVLITPESAAESVDEPLVAVTSSRLGHDQTRQRRVCRLLSLSVIECRRRGGTLLVGSGSAIEPWALRAAELYGVPVLRFAIDESGEGVWPGRPFDFVVSSTSGRTFSRDAVMITLADRVDAVYVRRRGEVAKCLEQRLKRLGDATTRVAIDTEGKCAARELMECGAVGWFDATFSVSKLDRKSRARTRRDSRQIRSTCENCEAWTRASDEWLIHCTRGVHGPWPGETLRQYRDAMLLGANEAAGRGPLETLARIVRSGRLMASAVATRHAQPVVCFSAVPLEKLMRRRCYRAHLRRWDYEPYGVAIRLSAARRKGVSPVVYGGPRDRESLELEDRYRFHPIGRTYDWSSELEWRSKESIDLRCFDPSDVRLFVPDPTDAAALPDCPWRITTISCCLES